MSKIPYLVTEYTDVKIAKEAAINSYPNLKDKLEIAGTTKEILDIINNVSLWYQKDFSIDEVDQEPSSFVLKDGNYKAQDIANILPCDTSDNNPLIFDSSSLNTKLNVDNQINQVNDLMDLMKSMNSFLEKSGVPTDNSVITHLNNSLDNLSDIKNKIDNDQCVLPEDPAVIFDTPDYNCEVPPIDNEFIPTIDKDLPVVIPTDVKYPNDLPKECYDQIFNGLQSINTDATTYSLYVKKLEQMRKRYFLSLITNAIDDVYLSVCQRIVKLITDKQTEQPTFSTFYLSDEETLALFNNDISVIDTAINLTPYINNINNSISTISKDYSFNNVNSGSLVFPNFTINGEPSNINWYVDNINYQYFNTNNIQNALLDAYFVYVQSSPSETDIASFKVSADNSIAWINRRDLNIKNLLTNIYNSTQSIIPYLVQQNLTMFYTKLRITAVGSNPVTPVYVNVVSSSIKTSLLKQIQIIQDRVISTNNFITEYNRVAKFLDDFQINIKKKANSVVKLPCLAGSIDSNSNVNVPDKLDQYYLADPNMPFLDKLSYWRKFASVANITGLLPSNWTYGVIIPTTAGLIGIPMPMVWTPISVIPTPTGIYVIFIGQCGIMPSPFIYHFSGVSTTSGFLLSLRGPSDFLKLKPALIRNKTKSMVPPNATSSMSMTTNLQKDVPNLKYQSTSDQKKFTQFQVSNPLSEPTAAPLIPLTAPFTQILPNLLQLIQKAAFGSNKNGVKGSGKLPSSTTFIQDDLPPLDRLSVSNLPFNLYANHFALIGSYCGGIPMNVPPFPKLSMPVPPALPDIPETFL